MSNQKLTPEIESVLRAARIEGNKLFLTGQLSPQVYKKVKNFLLNVGAEWSRKEGCHVFKGDPNKLLFAIEEGVAVDEQKLTQKFYTPQWLVEKIVALADVKGKTVLEPSCGDGRVMRECVKQGGREVTGVDILPENCEGLVVIKEDFLRLNPDNQVDVAVGNPPFAKLAYLKHTLHAYEFVKEGGKLVFILPNSIHSNKKFQDFVADKEWEFEKVESGAFEDTAIETNIVTIWKE
jgi:SAM-dependent methyltransferase